MSIKQISFSPELLDSPEVKDVDESCLTSSLDMTQIDFKDNPDGHNFNFEANLPLQSGGDMDANEPKVNEEVKVSEDIKVNDDELEEKETEGLNKVDLWGQSGGADLDNLESEVTMDEITNNLDNPGEDPIQADDAIDENDRSYEEDGNTVQERLNEIRQFQMEMNTEETKEELRELENMKMNSLDFDLESLTKKLENEMDLYWDKNLDIAFVENKVDEYIRNYESKEYETYRKMLVYVLTKTKAGYKMSIGNKGEYILHKGDEKNYDIKLTPPKYIDLDRDGKKLQKEIKDTLFELYDTKVELVNNADKLLDEDLSHFRKLQKKYYNLKHTEAIYEAYHKKINDRKDDEIEMFLNFVKKKNNYKNDTVYAIDTKYVKAPVSFQDNIRQAKISSLELYNQIRNKFEIHAASSDKMTKEETKEMKELIKKYLSTGNTSAILNLIEQFQNKLKKMVNVIIEKKPVIDVSKNVGKKKSKSKKKKSKSKKPKK